MKTGKPVLLVFLCALALFCRPGGQAEVADLILHGGAVWTLNPVQPTAEAVAIRGERILAVGSNREIRRMIGPRTEDVDLQGAFVLPGFIDSHTHFLDGGFALSRIQLRDAKSREDFIFRIKTMSEELEPGEWILGGNWDHQQFDPPQLPHKDWIDRVTPENPVYVNRLDGHMVLANSVALKTAGITRDTEAPEGGEIIRDAETGEPTGILKDAAMGLVTRHIPEPALKEKIKAAEAAFRHASSLGVTSVHDMAYPGNLEVYQALHKAGQMTARLYVYIQITDLDLYVRLKLKTPFGDNLLKIGGLKGFVDGSLGSSTALFFEPYTDDPLKTGLLDAHMFPEGIMEQRLLQADRAGLQVAIHAIGDKANHIILDLIKKVQDAHGARDRRWRVEHAQHLLPEDIARFGRLDIIASVQPYHVIDDGRWAVQKIGRKRAQTTYAFKSLLDSGALLACGSDWTVAPLDPLTGICAAVTRQTLDGVNPDGWIPSQKISVEEAIKGYTLNGAYAEFAELDKGSIETGKLADLVVLDQNLFEIPPEKIPEAKVRMTFLGGTLVYKMK